MPDRYRDVSDDAVDDGERRRVKAYLERNPRARAEVQAHREVAACWRSPTSRRRPECGKHRRRAPRHGSGPEDCLAATSSGRRRGRAVAASAVALTAAAAAAAVAVVIARDDGNPRPAVENVIEQAYGEAWSDPDARRARLVSDDGSPRPMPFSNPPAVGFLSAPGLPELPASETYQLWGVYGDGDVISLGVIGNRPEIEPFSAEGDIDTVVISEQAGGVVSSMSGALLVGELA